MYPPLSMGGSKLPEGLFPIDEVLDVPPRKKAKTADPATPTVKKVSNSAFKKIILRYHPDKGQDHHGESELFIMSVWEGS